MTWERDFGDQLRLFDNSSSSLSTSAAGTAADLAGLDGFTVSSSTRPFHTGVGGLLCGNGITSSSSGTGGSQFNAQCHTWPTTDNDFSWSQIQVHFYNFWKQISLYTFFFLQEDEEKLKENHYPTYSELQIKWPKELGDFFCSEEVQDNMQQQNDLTRPDSGVGESVSCVCLNSICNKNNTKNKINPSFF